MSFGWELPPGCTYADIDRAFGPTACEVQLMSGGFPVGICGREAEGKCQECGLPLCWDHGGNEDLCRACDLKHLEEATG